MALRWSEDRRECQGGREAGRERKLGKSGRRWSRNARKGDGKAWKQDHEVT